MCQGKDGIGKKEDTYPLTVVCTAWQAAAQLVRNLMHGEYFRWLDL
jgi:hypothetical protein